MNRKVAMDKKNRKQEESAQKAMKKCGDAALQSGVSPGAVVSLQVDYRTCFNPAGLVAIVYYVQLSKIFYIVCKRIFKASAECRNQPNVLSNDIDIVIVPSDMRHRYT